MLCRKWGDETLSKRRMKKELKGADFMSTYGDLVTLLLTFFVLLFASSSTDSVKFAELIESFNKATSGGTSKTDMGEYIQLAVSGTQVPMGEEEVLEGDSAEENTIENLDELYAALQAYIKEEELESEVNATRNPANVEITLVDNLLFESGEAKVKSEAEAIIDDLGNFLASMDNEIIIEGHTDSRPIHTAEFQSNWELSAQRSINIVHHLLANFDIDQTRLSAIGHADTRPVADNNTEENMQKNRRVVIKILEKE